MSERGELDQHSRLLAAELAEQPAAHWSRGGAIPEGGSMCLTVDQ